VGNCCTVTPRSNKPPNDVLQWQDLVSPLNPLRVEYMVQPIIDSWSDPTPGPTCSGVLHRSPYSSHPLSSRIIRLPLSQQLSSLTAPIASVTLHFQLPSYAKPHIGFW